MGIQYAVDWKYRGDCAEEPCRKETTNRNRIMNRNRQVTRKRTGKENESLQASNAAVNV
jgi:hypothetical protein